MKARYLIIVGYLLISSLLLPNLYAYDTHNGTKTLQNLWDTVAKLIRVGSDFEDVQILNTHPFLTRSAIALFEKHYGLSLNDHYGDAKIEMIFGSIEEDIDSIEGTVLGGESVYWDVDWEEPINLTPITTDVSDFINHHLLQVSRTQNHYYAGKDNENNNFGRLEDCEILGGIPACDKSLEYTSAKKWATEHRQNYFRWSRLKELGQSDNDKRLKLRILGHALHLIEDMGSPAHVRNDNHIRFVTGRDQYEAILGELSLNAHYDFNGELPELAAKLRNLEGLNLIKKNSVDMYFDEIASIIQRNFFSKDTILEGTHGGMTLQNPRVGYQFFTVGNEKILYVSNDNLSSEDSAFRGVKLATAGVADLIAAKNFGAGGTVDLLNYFANTYPWDWGVIDRECVKDLWQRVGPMLIEYGAGVIAHFYEEFIGPLPTPQGPWLAFIEGNPGIPGDGVYVNTGVVSCFRPNPPIQLGQFTDGFTMTAFLPPNSTFQNTSVTLANLTNPGQCYVGIGVGGFGPAGTTSLNGIEGFFVNYPQYYVDLLVDYANYYTPNCSLTANDLGIAYICLSTSGVFVTTLDAAAILPGQNAVPLQGIHWGEF